VERGNTVLVVEQENAANLDGQASAVSPQRRRQGRRRGPGATDGSTSCVGTAGVGVAGGVGSVWAISGKIARRMLA
jgi:hypothetical protein